MQGSSNPTGLKIPHCAQRVLKIPHGVIQVKSSMVKSCAPAALRRDVSCSEERTFSTLFNRSGSCPAFLSCSAFASCSASPSCSAISIKPASEPVSNKAKSLSNARLLNAQFLKLTHLANVDGRRRSPHQEYHVPRFQA